MELASICSTNGSRNCSSSSGTNPNGRGSDWQRDHARAAQSEELIVATASGMIALSARACHWAIRCKEGHTRCIKPPVQSHVVPRTGNPHSCDGRCNATTTIIVHDLMNYALVLKLHSLAVGPETRVAKTATGACRYSHTVVSCRPHALRDLRWLHP